MARLDQAAMQLIEANGDDRRPKENRVEGEPTRKESFSEGEMSQDDEREREMGVVSSDIER